VAWHAIEKHFSLRKRSTVFAPASHAQQSIPQQGDTRHFTSVKESGRYAAGVDLSIVIPNFNTAKYVVAAVNSALDQTFTSLEVIVVDDGSTDDSLLKLEQIEDHRVTIVAQPNRGLAAARNTGISIARGKYIGLLDSDDVWYRRKAEKQLAAMEADPTLGLTFCHSAYLDENGALTGQLLISRCKRPALRELVFRNHVGNGSTPIIRRECFEQAGMFNESLEALEDQEMWVRIAARTRWKLQLVPEVLTGYRVRASSLTNSSYARYVEQAQLGIEAIRGLLPELSRRDADRGYAEFLRIISRKALSNGDVRISRTLMLDAMRYSPWLVFLDIRAMALLAIHLLTLPLPRRCEMSVYRFTQSVTRRVYALVSASAAMQLHWWEQ
jgi:glycosyltransferase involved in cell wall biosynthesis